MESESLTEYKNLVVRQEELKIKQQYLQEAREALDKVINFEN